MIFAIFAAVVGYSYANGVFDKTLLSPEEIASQRRAEIIEAQKSIDTDNLQTMKDCSRYAEKEARYPDELIVIRDECYDKGKKPDLIKGEIDANGNKSYSWTVTPATSGVPLWRNDVEALFSNSWQKISYENTTKPSTKRDQNDHGDRSLIRSGSIENVSSERRKDILSVLWLDACRITQDEDSHVTLKGGHIYALDIACERGESFTVSAPQWKKSYTVKAVGFDKRMGNYIVLENANYMFVFAHTESPHKVGDKIVAGQQIGYTNESGISTNIHLHFELWRDGYNITHEEMIGSGSRWNEKFSFRLLQQRGWYDWIDDAISFITSFEWFRDTSYEDPKGSGRWSIWFGTFASWEWEKISRDEAKKRIRSKVVENMEFIYQNRLALSWNERIALSSFFYNLGTGRPEMIEALKKRDLSALEKLWKSYINKGSIYEKWLSDRRGKEWKRWIGK